MNPEQTGDGRVGRALRMAEAESLASACGCRRTGCRGGRVSKNSFSSSLTAVTRRGEGSSMCCEAPEAWASRRWRSSSLRDRPSAAAAGGVAGVQVIIFDDGAGLRGAARRDVGCSEMMVG